MILDLGLIDYEEAYKIQKGLVAKRRCGEIEDTLIVAEHNAIFTIGRSGRRDNLLVDSGLLAKKGIKVIDVDRGGDITFHGPGQIILYPIIDLKDRVPDLHRHLRDLEEAIIHFLLSYSIRGERLAGRTGVWVDSRKAASIGIGVADWVTYHGLSINIDTDLRFFSMIRPCGLKDVEITSLSDILGKHMTVHSVKTRLLESFDEIFDGRSAIMA